MNALQCARARSARSRRNQSGFALPMVLAFVVVGTLITAAVLAYASTSFRIDTVYSDHNARISAERDALTYVLTTIRTDPTKGVQGNTTSATVAGVTATCAGDTGSGVAQGAGRTDRVVNCSTPSITTQVRFFDRSGDKPGVIEETLRWDVTG